MARYYGLNSAEFDFEPKRYVSIGKRFCRAYQSLSVYFDFFVCSQDGHKLCAHIYTWCGVNSIRDGNRAPIHGTTTGDLLHCERPPEPKEFTRTGWIQWSEVPILLFRGRNSGGCWKGSGGVGRQLRKSRLCRSNWISIRQID
jgi:hypothetical protein